MNTTYVTLANGKGVNTQLCDLSTGINKFGWLEENMATSESKTQLHMEEDVKTKKGNNMWVLVSGVLFVISIGLLVGISKFRKHYLFH